MKGGKWEVISEEKVRKMRDEKMTGLVGITAGFLTEGGEALLE